MSYIVTIAGSASVSVQSSAVIEAARRILRRHSFHSDAIVVRNLPSRDLLRVWPDALEAAHCLIERAQGIIIATPVLEASYSGLLKTFLDTLPPGALQDKAVLPITTGASHAPRLPLHSTLKSVLSLYGVGSVLRTLAIEDAQIQFEHGGLLRLEESAESRLRDSLDALTRVVRLPSLAFAERNDLGSSPISTYFGHR